MNYRTFRTPSALVNVMAKAAFKASTGLIRDFGEVENLLVSQKGPKDFVSNADHRAENIIRKELERARPGYGFLLEEHGSVEGTEPWTWVVDPLDGTLNFLHGFPHFAISIGVLKGEEPFAGVIYDPLRDELFWAEQNMGAACYNRRLRVSKRRLSDTVMVGVGHQGLESCIPHSSEKRALISVRHTGSTALDLAYVAAGRFDAMLSTSFQPWDVVAGIVLVREAKGIVSDWQGRMTLDMKGQIIASNGQLDAHTFEL